MTTTILTSPHGDFHVVEAYRLDRYDNFLRKPTAGRSPVVETYRLDRYDNNEIPCFVNLL